jgi:hypothetical protein
MTDHQRYRTATYYTVQLLAIRPNSQKRWHDSLRHMDVQNSVADRLFGTTGTLTPQAISVRNPLRKFQHRGELKKILRHWEHLPHLFAVPVSLQLHEIKEKQQIELCASLEIRFLIANSCTRCRWVFKVLSEHQCHGEFTLKTSVPHPLKNTYQIDTALNQILLAEQYL